MIYILIIKQTQEVRIKSRQSNNKITIKPVDKSGVWTIMNREDYIGEIDS